jgi:hypothetical protein
MEHQTLDALRDKAVVLDATIALSSKKALLLRWADLLAAKPHARAGLVHGFEFGSERSAISKQEWYGNWRSPLHVAYADPALRAKGFVSGTYEEAIRFFSLTDREAHYLLCDCHYLPGATLGDVARRVRRVARGAFLLTISGIGVCFPLLVTTFAAAMLLVSHFVR